MRNQICGDEFGTTKLTAEVRSGDMTSLDLSDVIAITEVRGYLA